MPGLDAVIASMGGNGATVSTATVQTVGTGVATVVINGGEFLDVPYMRANYGGGQEYPSNGQKVYVIAQEGWGMLILGSPAPGPPRDSFEGSTVEWLPTYLSYLYSVSGWDVQSTDELALHFERRGVSIYSWIGRPVLPESPLAGGSFFINVLSAESGGFLGGGAYIRVGLHNNDAPDGVLTTVPGTSEIVLFLDVGDPIYYPMPMDWVTHLLADTANGLYFQMEGESDFATIQLGPIHLNFL